jgi:hypothetical protein
MINSTLAQLQSAVSSMLTVDHSFNGTDSANGKPVPVITEKIGDLVTHVQQEIAKFGLVTIIATPDFKLENAKTNSLTAWVTLVILVSELVATNQSSSGTKIPAQVLVCRIAELLHWKSHNTVANVDFRQQLLELQAATLWKTNVTKDGTMLRDLTYLIKFQTKLVLKTL